MAGERGSHDGVGHAGRHAGGRVGTQAESQLTNIPVRGATGCRFGCLERWLLDGLLDPTTKVMVDECYKEAVAAQKNELLKAWLVTFDPNDLQTTGDLPADQIHAPAGAAPAPPAGGEEAGEQMRRCFVHEPLFLQPRGSGCEAFCPS